MALEITPQTKVGDLLEAYPHLEDVLVGQAPEFARLKNPILRKTVGKLATLAQAAGVGGLDPVELVNELRRAVGFDPLGRAAVEDVAQGGPVAVDAAPPAWFDESRIAARLDAAEFLEQGGHPLGEVKRQAATLATGAILALASPFVPAPLIEALRQDGCDCWTRREGSERFVTYVVRRRPVEGYPRAGDANSPPR